MILRTISYTFALVLACGPEKDGGAETSSTGETQSASTGASDPTEATTDPTTQPTTSTATSEASTGDVVTGSSTSVSTSSTSGGTESTGATDGTTGELPPGACRSDADCFADNFEICFAPGESNCGPCQVPEMPCFGEGSCGADMVCVPFVAACVCDPGEGMCAPKCDADSCGRGATCDAMTGMCEPFTCSQDGVTCPPLFECVPGSGGDECQRLACETDAECGGAPCVEGRCHEDFGVCQPPAP